MIKDNNISRPIEYLVQIFRTRSSFMLKGIILLSFFLNISLSETKAQDKISTSAEVGTLVYDEIPVLVISQGTENFFINVLYTDKDQLFVNIEDLFRTLKIACTTGQRGDSIYGFIENEKQTYVIDFKTEQIKVGDKIINSSKGLVNEMGSLYMESSLFAEVFGIMMAFNYRALSIILKSNFELPIIKLDRIEKMRRNISKIKGDVIVDTVLERDYHLLRFGTLDWGLASYQNWKTSPENNFSLGIGTEFLYGQADISVNYYDHQKFDNRQINFLWRWVDNNKRIIKQAQIGKISNQTISFISSQVIGAVIRNSPTEVRKAKGFYTINEYTEPNWTVELYINNVLVDYTKADASGLYVFKVPIVYGYTTLKLKFYGPLGEERTEERAMNIPYTIMPAKEFEYSLSAGVLQDSSKSRLAKADFNYGVNRLLTIGGGLEYLSSIPNGAYIPYAKFTIQPYSKLLLNSEYSHGVKTRILIDYSFFKDALLEIDYANYAEGQLATRFNAKEERKVKLSIPFRYKKISGYFKSDYTQLVYKTFNFNQASNILSVHYSQFSANSATQLNWIDNRPLVITSDLSISYRLKKGFTIRPSAKFNISEGKLLTSKAEIEKRIPKGYFSLSYERNFFYSANFVNLSFRYDLPFARTGISASHSRGNIYTSETAQGSLAFGSGNNHLITSNISSLGKGGISLYPFIDVNHNGIFDKGEKMAKNLSVKISGGRIIENKKDSIIRIVGLEPFISYNLELSEKDFENIALTLKKKSYKVLIDPNQFKVIEIPIIPVGEVSGIVSLKQDSVKKGFGRILVNIYDKTGDRIAQTLSESDGYIYFMGLEPGEYSASIDSLQLSRLDFSAYPSEILFKTDALEEGDVVDGVNFVLSSTKNQQGNPASYDPDLLYGQNITEKKDSEENIRRINDLTSAVGNTENNFSISKDSLNFNEGFYFVQTGAFRNNANAKKMVRKLLSVMPYASIIVNEEGLYKVRTGYFKSKKAAILCQKLIRDNGNTTFIGQSSSFVYWGKLDLNSKSYFVQAGAFRKEENAKQFAERLSGKVPYPVGIIIEDGYFKVRFGYFSTNKESIECYDYMVKEGFSLFRGKVKANDHAKE